MDTFLQMREILQSDLTINSQSTLYPPTNVNSALNRAYRKAGGLFRWPELEDAKLTSTEANWEYYDYPQAWQPDSIWKLVVDGVDYDDPLAFKDYLYEKENWSATTFERIWSSQWRRFFICPIPTISGDNNIEVHGQKAVSTMVYDEDITIFSYSMPECNEAVVLEAKAILKSKGDKLNDSAFASAEAKQILTISFGKIKQNQRKYERSQPFLKVNNMFKQ